MSQGAETRFTLALVPTSTSIPQEAFPAWLQVRPHEKDLEADPMSWLDRKRTGTLLQVSVRRGHLSNRRTRDGWIDFADAEQAEAVRRFLSALLEETNRRWVALLDWTGAEAEVRDLIDVDPGRLTPAELESARPDTVYRFWRDYRHGDVQ